MNNDDKKAASPASIPAAEEKKAMEDMPFVPGGPSVLNDGKVVDVSTSHVKNLFLGSSILQDHVTAIEKDGDLYDRQLHTMVSRKLHSEFTTAMKARILVACVVGKRREMIDFLLRVPGMYTIAEVLKAVLILDAPRQRRALQKKLAALEAKRAANENSVRTVSIARLRTLIHNLEMEGVANSSVSGAFAKKLRRWLGTIPALTLEFYLLSFSTEPWKQLLNIIHAKPSDFSLPAFQSIVYGADAPKDSMIHTAKQVTRENLAELLTKFPQLCHCYSFIRQHLKAQCGHLLKDEDKVRDLQIMGFSEKEARLGVANANGGVGGILNWILEHQHLMHTMIEPEAPSLITTEAKAILGAKAPLEDIIWFYEELACPEVDDAINERLTAGEKIEAVHARANYGKLMERLLLFRERGVKFVDKLLPYAERQLKEISVPRADDMRIAVMGDASGSMEVAIKTASIVGSLLSVAFQADLSFFDTDSYEPLCVPKNAKDAIKVVEGTEAKGATSMAAALWPYYEERRAMDLFILVSDEGENVPKNDLMFAKLFKRYKEEISPECKVFLVSFLEVGDEGKIKESLDAEGIPCEQFRLAPDRPDTSKFDALLGRITLETTALRARWEQVEEALYKGKLSKDAISVVKKFT